MTRDDVSYTLRWMRARAWIHGQREFLQNLSEFEDAYIRGTISGQLHMLDKIQVRYFLTESEQEAVWNAGKEMGF